jgi:hypothetical protein
VRLGIVPGIVLGIVALSRADRAYAGAVPPVVPAADSAPPRCLPADTLADEMLDTLRAMSTAATGTPAERRAKLRLPLLSTAKEVQQVTSGDRCATAARAADSVWARAKVSPHHAQRRVYLFLFGDFFVVADRKTASGKTAPASSFSSKWRYLGTIRF